MKLYWSKILRFHCQKIKCYKRLIYKQFVQVSGLCGPQFLSYLPKRFTHLCRALYGDAIPFWSTNMAAANQQKHLDFTFSIALSFHARASIRAHKHIFWYLKWLLLKIKRGDFFSTRQRSHFGVTHSEDLRVQIAVFLKWNNCYGMKLVQRFTFYLSST